MRPSAGSLVLDATCPLVAKVHIEGKRYVRQGRQLILIGHAGHPEVEGTRGQIDGPVYLVQNVGDVAALAIADDTPLAYVTQTTLSVDDTRAIIAALQPALHRSGRPGHQGHLLRHPEPADGGARAGSKLADVILVVGASNSSNSNRLREIGAGGRACRSYLIGSGAELDPSWVEGGGGGGHHRRRLGARGAGRGSGRDAAAQRPVEVSLLPGIVENVKFRLPSELLDA